MYSFQNDYSEGAHPNILRALETINYHQNNSYGLDEHSHAARELIQEALEDYSADIHFIAGGTLTNLTFISHVLKPYEAVISAQTGHINTHETGAIEATGHKVISVPAEDGKLNPDLIRPVLDLHENEHWVEPRLVYISNPTEIGTLTNLTFISHVLKPYEAVISAQTGHINTHETGAIEATGHKVISVPAEDGKLNPDLIRPVLDLHENEHWVEPRLVYISNPTEIGTLYTKEELEILYSFCQRHHLYLYIDGARLAAALAAEEVSHLTFPDLPKLCDAFYIGGTKSGAMFGEALVLIREDFKEHFRFNMKQRGAILAKGWMIGVQFEELFKDNLYIELGKESIRRMQPIKQAFAEAGIPLLCEAPTNQIFPIFPNDLAEEINSRYLTTFQCRPDPDHICLRFCTSWITNEEAVADFVENFKDMAIKYC